MLSSILLQGLQVKLRGFSNRMLLSMSTIRSKRFVSSETTSFSVSCLVYKAGFDACWYLKWSCGNFLRVLVVLVSLGLAAMVFNK